jgi:hypothetical protein
LNDLGTWSFDLTFPNLLSGETLSESANGKYQDWNRRTLDEPPREPACVRRAQGSFY